MVQVIECVPNFSEGRNQEVIETITATITSVPGVTLLDVKPDANHNRTVVTFVGDRASVKAAALSAAKKAMELIDLRVHKGEHPRMGATDVIPFVPVKDITMAECVELAKEVAEELTRETGIPTYLYEEAATAPHRRNLADIRQGEFEGLAEKMQDPLWRPDFGQAVPHPSAGATVVGARPFLVAFNVNLGTADLTIAKEIAKKVRGSSGGLVHVKALGVMLADRNITQVSMNMVDPKRTPLYRALELIKIEAARYGVPVVGSEIIGLVPLFALLDSLQYYLQLEGFEERQIL